MKQIKLLLLSLILFTNCEQIGEYYVGLNKQPDITIADFQPGLNVFGVLKTGPNFDTLNHHFEVQQLLFIYGNFDSVFVDDAQVSLTREIATGEKSNYTLDRYGGGIYKNPAIETAPGDRWEYTCTTDSFWVNSTCVIPNTPQISNIEITAENYVKFTVHADSTAFMYDFYLLSGENFCFKKTVPNKGVDTAVELKPDWDPQNGTTLLFIFASDQNLEKYYTTSNTFFKPNAFRPSFTTVEGGYGTFGAISSAIFNLQ
jgi:hypothetical protein